MIEHLSHAELIAALERERGARELLRRVAFAASGSASFLEVTQIVLDAVCAYTGWPLGHAYILSSDGSGELETTDLWHSDDPRRYEAFRHITARTRFGPGVGLPGRVLASGAAHWIMDVTRDSNFPRARWALDINVSGAFAFPVLAGGAVVMVLEFFSDRPREPDLPMLEVMGSVGLQLGNLFERKRAEAALAESELRFRSVAASANDAVISANRHGEIVSWNRAATSIFGYSPEEAIGKKLELVIPERFREAHRAGMQRLQATGTARVVGTTVELTGLRRDGSEFPIELSLAAWNIGEEPFYSGIARDISERRQAETRLRASAEAIDRKNSELASKNAELERSHAELLRTYRQAEQIFSAYAEVLPGSELDGKYRLESKIGSGGFGVVYKAHHLHLDRPVAIKIFRPATDRSTPELLARFRLEGISTCRVNHPGAVSVLDSGVSASGTPYMVMELLEGRTLADELRACRRLPFSRTAALLAAICDVLSTAHASGIVHRDVKPDNVFLHRAGGQEVVKVLDFGIAKLIGDFDPGVTGRMTGGSLMLGTPVYMSPERLRGEVHDGRADVYSVGVMLHEMLAGRPPFKSFSDGPWDLIQQHLMRPPPSLREIDARIPEPIDRLVQRILSKEPGQRPTAQELAAELMALRETIEFEPQGAVEAPPADSMLTMDPLNTLAGTAELPSTGSGENARGGAAGAAAPGGDGVRPR